MSRCSQKVGLRDGIPARFRHADGAGLQLSHRYVCRRHSVHAEAVSCGRNAVLDRAEAKRRRYSQIVSLVNGFFAVGFLAVALWGLVIAANLRNAGSRYWRWYQDNSLPFRWTSRDKEPEDMLVFLRILGIAEFVVGLAGAIVFLRLM